MFRENLFVLVFAVFNAGGAGLALNFFDFFSCLKSIKKRKTICEFTRDNEILHLFPVNVWNIFNDVLVHGKFFSIFEHQKYCGESKLLSGYVL